MKKRKLGIIGGSGLYDIKGLERPKWKKIKTAWGDPSGKILTASYKNQEFSNGMTFCDLKKVFGVFVIS